MATSSGITGLLNAGTDLLTPGTEILWRVAMDMLSILRLLTCEERKGKREKFSNE